VPVTTVRYRGIEIGFARDRIRIVFDHVALLVLRVRLLLLSFIRAVGARFGIRMLQARKAFHPICEWPSTGVPVF